MPLYIAASLQETKDGEKDPNLTLSLRLAEAAAETINYQVQSRHHPSLFRPA